MDTSTKTCLALPALENAAADVPELHTTQAPPLDDARAVDDSARDGPPAALLDGACSDVDASTQTSLALPALGDAAAHGAKGKTNLVLALMTLEQTDPFSSANDPGADKDRMRCTQLALIVPRVRAMGATQPLTPRKDSCDEDDEASPA